MTGRAYYLTTLAEWQLHAGRFTNSHWVAADPSMPVSDASLILVLVEADEAAHLALEQHPGFEPLPHPLSAKPVSARVADKLAGHGVPADATTFDAAEFVARAHPLLRHRVF
jgi:hypothetical protein